MTPRLPFKLLAIASLLAASTVASATNVGVFSTGNNASGTTGVAAWLQASGQFSSVTGTDLGSLSAGDLAGYDAVLYFSNASSAQDTATIDAVLNAFADSGRRLVLATFGFANQGYNTLGSAFLSGSHSPFSIHGASLYSNVTVGSTDGSALFNGVNAITGYYHDNVSAAAGAVLRASWSDGSALVAQRGNVIGVNLFPDDAWGEVSGDHRQLFVNALAAPVPEPASYALMALGLVAVAGAAARRHQG